jgi:hypothetical protein
MSEIDRYVAVDWYIDADDDDGVDAAAAGGEAPIGAFAVELVPRLRSRFGRCGRWPSSSMR